MKHFDVIYYNVTFIIFIHHFDNFLLVSEDCRIFLDVCTCLYFPCVYENYMKFIVKSNDYSI